MSQLFPPIVKPTFGILDPTLEALSLDVTARLATVQHREAIHTAFLARYNAALNASIMPDAVKPARIPQPARFDNLTCEDLERMLVD